MDAGRGVGFNFGTVRDNKIMKTLIEIAEQFKGIQEIPGNQGWKEDKFIPKSLVLGQKMGAVGWQKGWAWCMLFAQVLSELYLTQFNTAYVNEFRKLFSPSATKTLANFRKAHPEMVSDTPSNNSIAIWQQYKSGKPSWEGHAGIVKEMNYPYLLSIDGNTSNKGGRTGDGVYEVLRHIGLEPENGLRFQAFINLPEKG
jgi:hypothetical protein